MKRIGRVGGGGSGGGEESKRSDLGFIRSNSVNQHDSGSDGREKS